MVANEPLWDPKDEARAQRPFDLLIAATALAFELPLYTRDPADFRELGSLVEIVELPGVP